MKQFFGKSFILFLSLIFASCAEKNEQQPRIRIVDLNGKSHPVVTKMPELNKQAINSQGMFQERSETFENRPSKTEEKKTVMSQTVPEYVISEPKSSQKIEPSVSQNNEKQEVLVGAGKQSDEAVEYDLSSPKEDAKPEPKTTKKHAARKGSSKGFFVQVGSFANIDNADKVLAKMQKFHQGQIETSDGEAQIHRVLLGPFTSKTKALALMKKIKASGHEAVLMRKK